MREIAIRRNRPGHRNRPGRWWRAAALVLLAALGALLGTLLGASRAAATTDGGELSSRQVLDRAQPGVRLVTVEHTAEVSAPGPALDTDRLMAAVAGASAAGSTGAQALDRMAAEIHRDPLAYLRPVPGGHTTPVTVTATGAAFAVNPDGHLVTSAHLVAPDPAAVEAAIAERALVWAGAALAEDPATLIGTGGQVTAAQRELLADATERFIAHHLQVGPVATTVTVAPPAGAAAPQQPRSAEVVAAGDPASGKDVAVILADGATSMPTVPLGEDTAITAGDRLYAVGYPDLTTRHPALPEEQPEPTVAAGQLSGRQTTGTGVTALRTDAAAGGSGGPVLDAAGTVVGITASGGPEGASGRVLPASVVREILQQAGVTPAVSTATRTYNRALDAFDQHRYAQALPLFRAVEARDPDYPHVGRRITDSQTAIAQGRDETPRTGPSVPAAAAVAGAVLVGLAAVLAAARLRRGRAPARHAHTRRPDRRPSASRPPYAPTLPKPTPPAARPAPLPPTTWAPSRTLQPACAAPAAGAATASWWSLFEAEPAVKLRAGARCARCGVRPHPAARSCATCGNGVR